MGKPRYSEKNLPQCHTVHHKSHTDWPEIETGTSRYGLATNIEQYLGLLYRVDR
jgi:hypothetical protein